MNSGHGESKKTGFTSKKYEETGRSVRQSGCNYIRGPSLVKGVRAVQTAYRGLRIVRPHHVPPAKRAKPVHPPPKRRAVSPPEAIREPRLTRATRLVSIGRVANRPLALPAIRYFAIRRPTWRPSPHSAKPSGGPSAAGIWFTTCHVLQSCSSLFLTFSHHIRLHLSLPHPSKDILQKLSPRPKPVAPIP